MFSKRTKLEDIPSTKEYTASILSRIACKGYGSFIPKQIPNHSIVYPGKSSFIDSGDPLFKIQNNTDVMLARSALNGLYLPEMFNFSIVNRENTTESYKIWSMFQFYGASIKSHVNNSDQEIDEPVAMVSGVMSVMNRSPTRRIPFGSMLFYHFPTPNQDQSYGNKSISSNKIFERLPLDSEYDILNKQKLFDTFLKVHLKDDLNLAIFTAYNILHRLNFDRDTLEIIELYGKPRADFGRPMVHHVIQKFDLDKLVKSTSAKTADEKQYLKHTFWLLQEILNTTLSFRHVTLYNSISWDIINKASPDIRNECVIDGRITRFGAVLFELVIQLMTCSVDIYQSPESVELTRRMYSNLPVPKADFSGLTADYRLKHGEYYKTKSASYKTLNCLIKNGLNLLGLRFAGVSIESAAPGGKYQFFQYPGMRQVFNY